jgi:DNA-binding transcriptional ArsR family regulator
MTQSPGEVPASSGKALEFLVFAGAYGSVLERTAGGYADADAPSVIGALALSGRLEEAESAFAAYRTRAPAEEGLARAHFFLIAGLCHAGSTARAWRHALGAVPEVFGAQGARRFWACQGLALVRYFEGRFRRARRFARRALAAAVGASFPYARCLALDLLAHVSVHAGDIYAGLRLLSQAQELAAALGYTQNAATLRTAALIFQLRFTLGDPARVIEQVEALTRSAEVSYFTRRNAWIELACSFALRGEGERAAAALEAARSIALTGTDSRGKVRWLVAHALCSALARGPEPARESISEAHALAAQQLTLETEIGFVQLVLAGERAPELLERQAWLARQTGAQRARIALDVAQGHTELYAPRVEDGMGRLLLECIGRPPRERVQRVVEAGFLGLLPWALERAPGRRVIVTDSQLISELAGRVRVQPTPHRPVLKLLFALRLGHRSREELLREVWGIQRFLPGRHLPTLHTAISRLRLALGDPDWVITRDEGYALPEGVELISWEQSAQTHSASAAPPPDTRARLLEFVRAEGETGSREIAEALELSASTALRLLRSLTAEGLLVRAGSGRLTRYRCAPE